MSGIEVIFNWLRTHSDAAGPEFAVPARTPLFSAGEPCRGFPVLLEGEVQVWRGSPQGRRLELYRVCEGEICLVSTAALFAGAPLSADAATTQDTRLRLITPAGFARLGEDAAARAYLFGQFAQRLGDLMEVTDAVAFRSLDRRLANALLGRGPVLAVSHQDLANLLGTAREIVTRLLRRFEDEGWVALGRTEVRVLDPRALRRHAEGEAPGSSP